MFGFRTRLLTTSLVLGCLVAALAEPRQRNVWHAYVADGQRYGYQHTTVTKRPDGNFRYIVELRVLIDMFGVQKQEITSRAEYAVTPTYELLTMKSESEQASGTARVTGRVQDGKLLITRKLGDQEHVRAYDSAAEIIPDGCLADWLADQPADRNNATVRVLRAEGWSVEIVKLALQHRDESGSQWRIELPGEGTHGTVSYDADGSMREMKLDVPKLHVQRCTAEQAKSIEYRKLDGRYVLTFPLNKDISAPHRLTQLTVKLTWEDLPLDRFELEDRRQRIVGQSEHGAQHEVVVKIGSPPTLSSQAATPPSDGEMKCYLSESRFIKPKHERIRSAALEVIKGKKSPLEKVQALSKWVSEYIEGSLIAETLSGPEVLELKTGKCSEYSTLFASLARAAGIPTRIVLGDRMVAGQ